MTMGSRAVSLSMHVRQIFEYRLAVFDFFVRLFGSDSRFVLSPVIRISIAIVAYDVQNAHSILILSIVLAFPLVNNLMTLELLKD